MWKFRFSAKKKHWKKEGDWKRKKSGSKVYQNFQKHALVMSMGKFKKKNFRLIWKRKKLTFWPPTKKYKIVLGSETLGEFRKARKDLNPERTSQKLGMTYLHRWDPKKPTYIRRVKKLKSYPLPRDLKSKK